MEISKPSDITDHFSFIIFDFDSASLELFNHFRILQQKNIDIVFTVYRPTLNVLDVPSLQDSIRSFLDKLEIDGINVDLIQIAVCPNSNPGFNRPSPYLVKSLLRGWCSDPGRVLMVSKNISDRGVARNSDIYFMPLKDWISVFRGFLEDGQDH